MYVTAQMLRDAIGPQTYVAIFDDQNLYAGDFTALDASTQVVLCLERAHSQVKSRLPDIYKKMPTEQPSAEVSNLLIDAELSFALIYSYRRHPEYCKTYGAQDGGMMWKEANGLMDRIQTGTQRIPPDDNPPEPVPANVGGSSQANGPRMSIDSPNGCNNSGDWG